VWLHRKFAKPRNAERKRYMGEACHETYGKRFMGEVEVQMP
jgi:hypothetical protein